jgi:subtilisin family serine protease
MPVYRNPPWRFVAAPLAALAESVDWSLGDYGVPALWQQSRGEGVKVAILDTGCQVDHPDLTGAIAAALDFTDSPWGVGDRQGHGTWCAGLVAARQNARGLTGIAPACQLLVGKVLGDDGSGLDAWIVAGIEWAAANGANLISLSLGSPDPSPTIARACMAAEMAGILVICAAGNDGHKAGGRTTVNFPARYPSTLAVSAVDKAGVLAPFSSAGPEVDVAAPGVDMLSTFPTSRYARLSGTSMACPFVAGVAALAIAKHRRDGGATPLVSIEQLREHLLRGARDAGSIGRDDEYGAGIIRPGSVLGAEPGPAPVLGPGQRIVARVPGAGVLIFAPD